jgi:methyl-accepting chemotaxis protein/cytochrome b561
MMPTTPRYSPRRRLLHWIIAGLVIIQVSILLLFRGMQSLDYGRVILDVHLNVGVVILLLSLAYPVLALIDKAPPAPERTPGWQKRAALVIHVAMMVLLGAIAIAGICTAWARGNAVPLFFLIPLNPPFSADVDLADRLLVVHGWLARGLIALLFVHLCAIAFNWRARGQNVLTRMLPAQNPVLFKNRAPIWAQLSIAFGALMAMGVFVGLDAMRHTRQVADIAAETYDRSFLSLSHARSAQAHVKELIGLSASGSRLERQRDLTEMAVADLEVVAARAPDAASRDEASALLASVTQPNGAGLTGDELAAFDTALEDLTFTLTGKSFEARTAISTVAANSHDLILLSFAPMLAIAAFAALLVWANIAGLINRSRQMIRAIVAADAETQIEVIGNGELADLMRDVLACRASFAAQRAEIARMALTEEGDRREDEIQTQLDEMIGSVVAAARAGDFSRRAPEGPELGRFLGLAQGLNAVCAVAERFLEQVELQSASLAKGDLSRRITAPFQGRFARVAADLNKSAEALSQAIGNAADAGARTRERAATIQGEAQDLARRSQQQAASLASTAAAMNQVTIIVRDSADHAEAAARGAREATQRANAGGKLAADAVGAVERIDKSSRRVAEILVMIKEIATQTNRLSLNAAIEAARAGEHGKGFAAVASEVRALAQRSAQLAEEIKDLVDESRTLVGAGVTYARATGEALGDIVTSIRDVSARLDQISSSSHEQARKTGDISSGVAEMDRITRKSALAADRTLSAAREMSEGATHLAALVASFQIGAETREEDRALARKA